jgi:hypothetical protein
MANTLYEKLRHTDVIPEQYACCQNIIDYCIDENDGYLVLYELLVDHHPAMKQDLIQTPPNSHECQDDIQEYSASFTSYLMSEHLNGRTFHPSEEVVLFLKGLDSVFTPAVQYIVTPMGSWGKDGLSPKCQQRPLPRTIEHLMKTRTEPLPIMHMTRLLQGITTDNFMEILCAANNRENQQKN